MPLTPGQTLGHYRIAEKIGEGGMGAVWRAVDTTLERDVAIKVLPAAFAEDAERLARFDREAKLLASLNHPHIAGIHGLYTEDSIRFLAMELVEGEDLAQRLHRGPLPLEDALTVATQVAEALEEAHERGVVHRDLKPANIKLMPDGTAKVLDFGLAKAMSAETSADPAAPSLSPTVTSFGSTAGVLVGTAAYMSPEQAKGKPVDRRADIWAFGVVLYEALTGSNLFHRETISETLASVLMAEMDLNALPDSTPARLRELLRRCLDRDPRKRLRDIGEARVALSALLDGEAGAEAPEARVAAVEKQGIPGWLWLAAGLLVGGLAMTALLWGRGGAVQTGEPAFLAVPLGNSDSLAGMGSFALSPDGRTLAYVGHSKDDGRQLVVRSLDRPAGFAIPDTARMSLPTISPDGQSIAFFDRDAIRRVSILGGPLTTVHELSEGFFDMSGNWTAELGILARSVVPLGEGRYRITLWSVSPDGQTVEELERIEEPPGEIMHFALAFGLPNGRGILYNELDTNEPEESTIWIRSMDDGSSRELTHGLRPVYAEGHLLFRRGDQLLAAPLDDRRLELTGTPRVLVDGLIFDGTGRYVMFDASERTLAYVSRDAVATDVENLRWLNRSGEASGVKVPQRPYVDLRLSPDGSRLAYSIPSQGNDIWVLDFDRRTQTRLTFESSEDETPLWSPDGEWVFYSSARGEELRQIHRRRPDGTGEEELIWEGTAHLHLTSMTPDGGKLVVDASEVATGPDVAVVDVTTGELERVVDTPFRERHARLSPDGGWLAYSSNESDEYEVYVRRFPEMDRKIQISNGTGDEPVWSADGRELYYLSGKHVMVVDVRGGADATFSAPRVLFEGGFARGKSANHFSYDVAPDGRFITTARDSDTAPKRVDLLVNWRRLLDGSAGG